MEKEIERRISLFHAIVGALFGIVTTSKINSELTILSTIILGIIVSYPLMITSKKIFKLSDEEFKLKDWITKGFFYFYLVWIIVWTFFFNLV
jgi:hypothetical protein